MKKVEFQLQPLTCPSCIKKIEGALGKTAGVQEARVLFHSSKVKVEFNEETVVAEVLKEKIEKLGYPVKTAKVK